jgi:hypothetical protein
MKGPFMDILIQLLQVLANALILATAVISLLQVVIERSDLHKEK